MNAPSVKQEIVERLNDLNEDDLLAVLRYIDSRVTGNGQTRPYDPAKDPMIEGIFDGPRDLSERTEEILGTGIGQKPMSDASIKQSLVDGLRDLDDLKPEHVQRYIEIMNSMRLSPDYDPDNDPLIGFFSGPPDLAERTEEILEAEFGLPKSEDEDE